MLTRREYDLEGNLISVREVCGRDATPEEQIRLKKFAEEWVAGEQARLEEDRKTLVRLMTKYMKANGYSKRDIDKYVRKNTPVAK